MHRTGLFILVFCAGVQAAAEYRAFELVIHNPKTGTERIVVSTLDHIQYPMYHALNPGETVIYSDSWRCREDSDNFKKICPKPERAPTAQKPKSAKAKP